MSYAFQNVHRTMGFYENIKYILLIKLGESQYK